MLKGELIKISTETRSGNSNYHFENYVKIEFSKGGCMNEKIFTWFFN